MSQTVHFQGNPVTVANVIPQAGSKAQAFTLVAKDLSDVSLSQYAGKRKVLNISQALILAYAPHQFVSLINWPQKWRIPSYCAFLLTCLLHSRVFAARKA